MAVLVKVPFVLEKRVCDFGLAVAEKSLLQMLVRSSQLVECLLFSMALPMFCDKILSAFERKVAQRPPTVLTSVQPKACRRPHTEIFQDRKGRQGTKGNEPVGVALSAC